MARVVFGAGISEIRGKVGGSVFQRNAHGFTMKNAPNMKRPNSFLVYESQSILAYVTGKWSSAAQSVRDAFNDYASAFPQYAKNNPSAQLSGYNIYVMWQATRLNAGSTEGGLPDSFDTVFPTVAPSLTRVGPILSFNLNESASEPDAAWAIFATPPSKPAITFPPSNFRLILNTGTGAGAQDISAAYTGKFSALPSAADVIWLKAVPYGLLTPEVEAALFFRVVVA